MKRQWRWGAIALAMMLFGAILAGCLDQPSNNPPSALCGYVIGDGSSGHDTRVHRVVYPNQNIHLGDHEDARYVPCNSRNFIANAGQVTNVNGQKVGDRFTPTQAFTQSGAPVEVQWSAYWTLNEDRDALLRFYELCFKYQCASNEPKSGNANFSTPGWNGMLGENFAPSVDATIVRLMTNYPDTIWQKHDPALYDQLATAMSQNFDNQVRKTTGYNVDLFCGSGNSSFRNPAKHTDFNCTNVRFRVDYVGTADNTLAQQAAQRAENEQSQQVNAARLKAAQQLYGNSASYWLGLQDTLADVCKQGSSCVINIGGNTANNGGVSVPVPTG